MNIKHTLGILLVSGSILSSGLADNNYYEEDGMDGERTTEENIAAERAATVFKEIAKIREAGDLKTKIDENRAYLLVPTIREVARSAQTTKSTAILGQLVALASCESDPARSYEWVDSFGAAVNEFTENEFREVLSTLPEVNRRSLRNAVAANMLDSFKWKNALAEIQDADEAFMSD